MLTRFLVTSLLRAPGRQQTSLWRDQTCRWEPLFPPGGSPLWLQLCILESTMVSNLPNGKGFFFSPLRATVLRVVVHEQTTWGQCEWCEGWRGRNRIVSCERQMFWSGSLVWTSQCELSPCLFPNAYLLVTAIGPVLNGGEVSQTKKKWINLQNGGAVSPEYLTSCSSGASMTNTVNLNKRRRYILYDLHVSSFYSVNSYI